SANAVAYANQRARARSAEVRFFPRDVLRDELPEGYDVFTVSLFLHHLEEEQAVDLLRRMARATRQAILVNDLVRSALGYALAWLGTRVLSRSDIVHMDGPLSVRAAFSVAEVSELARRAGLEGAWVKRCWPWRFLLTWSRK